VKTNNITHIHRFNDKVAITFEGQPTIYLSEQHAGDVANALKECAADLSQRPNFTASTFNTKTIES
jgi:hypothetical protein